MFLFFKQKTAYEMRISDWSSEVCSSDLTFRKVAPEVHRPGLFRRHEHGFRIVLLLGTVLRILPCARPAVPVHAVHDVLSKVQATAAAGAVSEGQIDLRDATQAALRHLADFDVPIAVAQADVHPGLLTMRTPKIGRAHV